jgi:hypothetical protein
VNDELETRAFLWKTLGSLNRMSPALVIADCSLPPTGAAPNDPCTLLRIVDVLVRFGDFLQQPINARDGRTAGSWRLRFPGPTDSAPFGICHRVPPADMAITSRQPNSERCSWALAHSLVAADRPLRPHYAAARLGGVWNV